jgi:hypothetical protein
MREIDDSGAEVDADEADDEDAGDAAEGEDVDAAPDVVIDPALRTAASELHPARAISPAPPSSWSARRRGIRDAQCGKSLSSSPCTRHTVWRRGKAGASGL